MVDELGSPIGDLSNSRTALASSVDVIISSERSPTPASLTISLEKMARGAVPTRIGFVKAEQRA